MKKLWLYCLIAAAGGGAAGYFSPLLVASAYDKLFSVAILTGLESLFGGIRLLTRDNFDGRRFLCNFAASIVIVVAFVFVGDNLGLDLYYVVLLAIGFRLLQDPDIIKIRLFNK